LQCGLKRNINTVRQATQNHDQGAGDEACIMKTAIEEKIRNIDSGFSTSCRPHEKLGKSRGSSETKTVRTTDAWQS
jgi:hypothetical protein